MHHAEGMQARGKADPHDNRDACDEVSSLLSDLGALIVEAPLDGAADLGQVRLGAHLQAVHHRAKTIQHHIGIIADLHGHHISQRQE